MMAPHSKSTKGVFRFQDLPYEVRELIYYQLVRPWNPTSYSGRRFVKGRDNAVGCTNILLLNKTIYREAIQVFHELPVGLVSQRCGGHIFRHPLSQGKPGLFRSSTQTSAIDIDYSLSELEFIKLRYANINIRYGRDAFNDPVEDLRAITAVLRKSHNLKEIHLVIGPAIAREDRRSHYVTVGESRELIAPVRRSVGKLITRCIAQKITLTASSFTNFLECPGRFSSKCISYDRYSDPIAYYVNKHVALIESNKELELNAEYRLNPSISVAPFLQPECKHCYALFATPVELLNHLRRFPFHDVPFRRKDYNPISRFAKSGGDRHACLVCAQSYVSARTLWDHCEKFKHGRADEQGIVPRWKEDNNWFDIEVWKTSPSENDRDDYYA